MRGLIGPREVSRLWDRHLLNCAVIAEQIPQRARVVDVGSGAGLPGMVLALARPDLDVVLLEPMARRVTFLSECKERLQLSSLTVYRGRAEDGPVVRAIGGADVVTARAVAPLDRLVRWCLPLLRVGGTLLAMKGDSAEAEAAEASAAIKAGGGRDIRVFTCGKGVVTPPTRLVAVVRGTVPASARGGRTR